MKKGTYTVNILEPENGGYLTQSKSVEMAEVILSKKIFLAVNDSADNYKEITEEEAEKIKQAQKELDPSLYPTEEQERLSKISFFKAMNKSIASERKSINTMALTDDESLKYKVFYPLWEDLIGTEVDAGFKFTYKDTLYRVRQKHTISAEWIPDVETGSLYEVVNESHSGTKEDPIPYSKGMELELGKYYSQYDILYMCIRDSGQAIYNDLATLVDLYVVVSE